MGERINGMGKPEGLFSLGALRERVTLGGTELGTSAIHARVVLTTTAATAPVGP